jgi:DNA-directed RNA polymerase subunit beta'
LGVYYLTREESDARGVGKAFMNFEEAIMAYDAGILAYQAPVRIGDVRTTLGRMIFNRALGGVMPYVNETLSKKKFSKVIESLIEQQGIEGVADVIDRLKLLGFEMSMRSGISWAISDLIVPTEKKQIMGQAEKEVLAIRDQYEQGLLTEDERRVRVISVWDKAKNDLWKLVSTTTLPKDNVVYQVVDSGARGSWTQLGQVLATKGPVQNPRGEIIELPVKSSFKEGLSVLEYFISTHGARKGTTDTALKTAQAGYLTRRLVDVAQDVVIREEDCRAKEGIIVKREEVGVSQSFGSRLFSRTVLEDVKSGRKVLVKAGEIIDRVKAEEIQNSDVASVTLRSPLFCRTLFGLCRSCYGLDLGRNVPVEMGTVVGVLAAQSIGEPGTQLTMRTFHIGGVAGADITHGLPRVEELFEVRPPKGKAILAAADGTITSIEEKGTLKTVVMAVEGERKLGARSARAKKAKTIEYAVPRMKVLFVNVGDKVAAGDQLSEGHIDLRELLTLRGEDAVVKYIMNEVQKIYGAEGAAISNKHIEVIVRQMFSRVRIKDAGDAPELVMGEIVEKSKFLEVNRALKKEKKTPAKAEQLLLGITRVALSTESFLSAASFQDTARVLVKAAVEGKVDPLRGLKENVIIGRLIPGGNAASVESHEPTAEGDTNAIDDSVIGSPEARGEEIEVARS